MPGKENASNSSINRVTETQEEQAARRQAEELRLQQQAEEQRLAEERQLAIEREHTAEQLAAARREEARLVEAHPPVDGVCPDIE